MKVLRPLLATVACPALLALAQSLPVHAATPMVSFGLDHVLALSNDGRVFAWGSDQYGKLGTGSPILSAAPLRVNGISGAVSVAGGYQHSIAVLKDGSVWTWGQDNNGQLGDGGFTDQSSPIPVSNFTGAVAACAGDAHSAALRADGTVWTWGSNGTGQLGTGTYVASAVPVPVTGLTNVTAIACGAQFTMALRQDGSVWVWGTNQQGSLGIGAATDANFPQPVRIPTLSNVISIAAGQWAGAAVRQDGTVWEWGYVFSTGQVRSTPVQSPGISGAVSVTCRIFSLRAFASDKTRWWAWDAGTVPVQQDPVGNIVSIAEGFFHTLILLSNGQVISYGFNPDGQLGVGNTDPRNTPSLVGLPTPIKAIAAGYYYSLAVDMSGNVWAWGSDSSGQLGQGRLLKRTSPVLVQGLPNNIVQVSAGSFHSAALDANGNLWVWGGNTSGELGTGDLQATSSPVRLMTIANVAMVSAGDGHTLAAERDGSAWSWGANSDGQVGDGTSNGTPAPIRIPNLADVVAVSAGSHSMALTRDGSVWTWGRNHVGQLGLGTTTPLCCASPPPNGRPAKVPGISGITAIVATGYNSYALKSDGTVLGWGYNGAYNVGDGTSIDRATPTPVVGLSGVTQIGAGIFMALARRVDGSVWGWGQTAAGELGPSAPVVVRTAAPIPGLQRIEQACGGLFATAFLSEDGWTYTGGSNAEGQLGDGTFAQHRDFVLVLNSSANGFLNLVNSGAVAPGSVPFFVNSQGVISTGRSTVNVAVNFRGQDLGKPIFIFGYAPASLVKRVGEKDDGCVLAQLSPGGQLQSASASTLAPYASNVTSTVAQAVSVLNSIASQQLAGATFCIGAGVNGTQSIDPANNRCVATIPSAQPCLGPESTATPNVPGAFSGLWWNSSESGWGIDFTQRRNVIFAAWYTYDATGNPKWYVASNCTMPAAGVTSGACNGSLYEVNGPTFFGTAFNPNAVNVIAAGSLSVNFADASHASMTYTVGSQTRTVNIVRQVFAAGPVLGIDYTDLWWNPNESGWGMAVTQQASVMFLAWYVYDASGKPMWYVASNCAVSGNGCSGTLYRTTGPAFGPAFDSSKIQVFTAGTVTLSFTDPNNGVLSYTVNGVTGTKSITRQLF